MINFHKNLSQENVYEILILLDTEYEPKLSEQVNIWEYSNKLSKYGSFITYEEKGNIKGLVGFYLNEQFAFISTYGLHSSVQGKGIAKEMFDSFLKIVSDIGVIFLDVNEKNLKARKFYKKLGFKFVSRNGDILKLKLRINER